MAQQQPETDEVFHVETHGIDPIPDDERHGSAKDLFWLWFGSNLTFTYVINGALAVAFGLSFWQATAVVVIGGLAFFAISAAGLSGIRTGTATLVISRAAFGVRGNWPAGLLNWVVSIGYTIVNTVVGTLALEAFLADLGWRGGGPARALALLVTLALTFAVAMWGHATVQFAERWMAYLLAAGFAALLVFVVPGADTLSAPASGPGAAGWSLAFVVMLAGPFSYLPMPADYTRYLPKDTSLRALTWSGALGGLLSSVALGIIGVAAATRTDMTDAVAGTEKLLPGWFQPVFLALVLGGSVTNSIITLYSSSLNLQVLGIPWTRAKAIVISAAVTALGSAGALFLADFTASLLSFLSLLIIVFAPWGGVFLADMLLRRCRYDTRALHAGSEGAYWYRSGYHPAGVLALLAGITFAALTCDSELWTGPLVAPLGGADLTLLGSVVSGLVYAALARRAVRAPGGGEGPADLVLTGARIHTVDPDLPEAQALAVRDGRIVWLGADADTGRWTGPRTKVIEAGGRLVLPGFIDAHNHVRLGSDDACVQLAGARSLETIHQRIRDWHDAHPDAEWIEAEAFDYSALPDGRMPRAADLDPVTGDTPAFVLSYDVHTAWLNTAALRRLGIDRDRTSLPYGEAETDPETGEPTGFLRDFAIKGLSRDGHRALRTLGVPWASPDRQYGRLAKSLDDAIRFGLTTVVEPQNSLDDLALFERARAEGRLRSRIVAALFHPRGTTAADLDAFAAAARRHHDDRLRVGPLKLYIDDVVEPRTAALLEPYAGCRHHRGETFYPAADFGELLTELDARGFQCFVHATGDRGIRTVLDAVERARAVNGPRDARHQVVHVECLDPRDTPRFAELGVVACMQPRHCAPEIAGPGQDWAENIGPDRWHKAWPMRSLHTAGARLAFSSDWNVAEMDPMIGIYTAVTRQPLGGGEAWQPAETVSVRTAVHAYTMGSAYANFLEDERGSLTVGKLADFVVLSRDILRAAPEDIPGTVAETVVVGGEIVHETSAPRG